MKARSLAVLSSALLLLTGCATAISKDLVKQAVPLDKFDFGQVRKSPESFRGKTVILGGQILEIRNRADGTVLVVFEKPLDRWLQPRPVEMGGGRFQVHFAEYLDPAVFSQGRTITVAGAVAGTAPELIGEYLYAYVVLEGREVHLWKEGYAQEPPWYERAQPYPYPPWYDPYWGNRPWP